MWDPGFHSTEVRLADVDGYQRRFTFKIEIGSGSPEHPGLALSLEQQTGCCKGLVFRIAADSVQAESEILWRREMLLFNYFPALVQAATPQGNIEAIAFVSDRSHPKYVGELPLNETAAIINQGVGIRGANRDYVGKLASALKMLDVDDPYVTELSAHLDTLVSDRVQH